MRSNKVRQQSPKSDCGLARGDRIMTKRESSHGTRPLSRAIRGRQYPDIQGKVVDFADHAFEEGTLYVRVRFTDKTELCWRITSSMLIEEADLGDWKTGDFRQLRVFVQEESGRE
jgi:hypothetical protein